MHAQAISLRELPLSLFDDLASLDQWRATPFSTMSDAHLVNICIEAISTPKQSRRNSFLLHAPLELLARAALLPHVHHASRDAAKRRMAEIAVRYASDGEEIELTHSNFKDTSAAYSALQLGIHAANAYEADAALCFLLQHESPAVIVHRLFDAIATSYGAAGHAPILFAELHRVCGRYPHAGHLLRAPLRYLVGQPNAVLHWADTFGQQSRNENATTHQSLWQALARPEYVLVKDHSIASQLSAPEALDRYARDLDEVSLHDTLLAERTLLRIAAHSMLQDDPAHAAYGWTHCLTMPLALMANAQFSSKPQRAAAMAIAEVYAFRAAMASVSLREDWRPEPPRHRELCAATPSEAASIAFHTSAPNQPALREKLATFAAAHRDAHLAKYTLACFDAAVRDPVCEALYLSAAAYLAAWWREFDAGNLQRP